MSSQASDNSTYILGGGMTGLAAGISSGHPVLEASSRPGGICSSYYVRPGETERLSQRPEDGEAYRFEIGGGHWIFGGDPTVLHFARRLAPMCEYERSSAIYFAAEDRYAPYPIQNHLRYLGEDIAARALKELVGQPNGAVTMKDWLAQSFGPTLCELFFYPFHERYTSGLYETIAPQDAYKSPVNISLAIDGAFRRVDPVGYNVTFLYPQDGLDNLARRMAEQCDIRYDSKIVHIDVRAKELHLADGTVLPYRRLVSTLPLNTALEMSDTTTDARPDPHTSVLVLNIGATRGERCPDEHWFYNPDAASGFHRVGFYSNVDRSFLPHSQQARNNGVSIYVERAYLGGERPSEAEVADYGRAVVEELQSWGYIGDA
jgi:protoporphyrinogen oxidase